MQTEADNQEENNVEDLEVESTDEVIEETQNTEEVAAEEPEEVVVSIGEDSPPQTEEAPSWVKELRKKHRELLRENNELKSKLQVEEKPPVLRKKPTLEDHEWDAEAYERDLAEWFEQKRSVDEAELAKRTAEENQKKSWQAKLDGYSEAKTKLKVKDFDSAEINVQEALNVTQQGIILQGAKDPALLVYAIGSNPTILKELSSINDPVSFAIRLGEIQKDMKVTNRKAPPPEKTVSGSGRISGSVDSTLERLRAEAEKTGDFTKVLQYKKQKAK